MQRIEDYKTLYDFYLKRYPFYEKYEEEKRNKIIQQDFKNNVMLITDDDYILLLNKKPTIDSDLWYDDETPTPEITLDYFKDYNKSNFNYDFTDYLENKRKLKECGYCSGMYANNLLLIANTPSSAGISCMSREKDFSYCIRELTNEEENYFLNVCDELKNLYNQRLEKYFTKYRNKIHARGYWVNR